MSLLIFRAWHQGKQIVLHWSEKECRYSWVLTRDVLIGLHPWLDQSWSIILHFDPLEIGMSVNFVQGTCAYCLNGFDQWTLPIHILCFVLPVIFQSLLQLEYDEGFYWTESDRQFLWMLCRGLPSKKWNRKRALVINWLNTYRENLYKLPLKSMINYS